MGNSYKKHIIYVLGLLIATFMLSPVQGAAAGGKFGQGVLEAKLTQVPLVSDQAPVYLDMTDPGIKGAMAVQEHNKAYLMGLSGVVGTATGVNTAGEPSVLVFTKQKAASGLLPTSLEGVPVVETVTGEIFAMRGGQGGINPAGRFARPVPIGVSTGNAGECSAGTISARLKSSSGNYYAMSNNHVYALENAAPIGSQVMQPGLYDTSCFYDPNNVIGTLTAFVTINFSGGSNTVDAAIALLPPLDGSGNTTVGKSTPSNGYGTPNSTTKTASLNMSVQKYGRTSSLTRGVITGVNATVLVNYGAAGTATFVNQITVGSNKPFIKAGDSGSLLVTDDTNDNPVGLLYAGSSSGTFAIANRIEDVLSAASFSGYGVSIDGK